MELGRRRRRIIIIITNKNHRKMIRSNYRKGIQLKEKKSIVIIIIIIDSHWNYSQCESIEEEGFEYVDIYILVDHLLTIIGWNVFISPWNKALSARGPSTVIISAYSILIIERIEKSDQQIGSDGTTRNCIKSILSGNNLCTYIEVNLWKNRSYRVSIIIVIAK